MVWRPGKPKRYLYVLFSCVFVNLVTIQCVLMLLVPVILQILLILWMFYIKNIQELHKLCYDLVVGLQTVLCCMIHTYEGFIWCLWDFSPSQKTNLFFTSVLNIYDDSKSLLFVSCCILRVTLVVHSDCMGTIQANGCKTTIRHQVSEGSIKVLVKH